MEFYKESKAAGIKPIIGVEAYVAPQGRHSRLPGDNQPYHLVLLAKNKQGYHNLLKLVTLSHLEGFYYRPRVDRELLKQYNEGIIAHIQIHDELDLSVESKEHANKIIEIMENAVKLAVPNKVDYESGKNWGDIYD